jgi:hypothetical protein
LFGGKERDRIPNQLQRRARIFPPEYPTSHGRSSAQYKACISWVRVLISSISSKTVRCGSGDGCISLYLDEQGDESSNEPR